MTGCTTTVGIQSRWQGGCRSRHATPGRWILHKHLEPQNKGRLSVRVIDFEATMIREVFGQIGRTVPEMACWSPDGRHIAVLPFNFTEDMTRKVDAKDQDLRIAIVDVAGG